jgi:ABC-2 type transport system permease protein
MSSFLAMTKANLKMTLRNRTALFWNLIFPALFIVLFGALLGNQNVEIKVGAVGDQSDYESEVVSALRDSESFTVYTDETQQEQLDALENGDRDVVLVFGAPGASGAFPDVTIYYDDTAGPNAQVSIGAVRQVLLSVANSESPVPIEVASVNGMNISYIDFLVPGILAMALMNSGVLGLATSFVSYREKGILRRIKVTPFPLSNFVGSRIASQLIIAVPQALILTGIAWALFDFHIRGNPLLILFVIVLGSLAFLSIGFAISSIARNTETAAAYGNLITFPMLFLSGVFFSLDDAPAWMKPITKVLPLSYLVDALRGPMTRGEGIEDIWVDIVALVLTFGIGMAIAVRYFKWDARTA